MQMADKQAYFLFGAYQILRFVKAESCVQNNESLSRFYEYARSIPGLGIVPAIRAKKYDLHKTIRHCEEPVDAILGDEAISK